MEGSSEVSLQNVLATVSEGVALWDVHGKLQYANPSFSDLFGEHSCCIGSTVFELGDAQLKDLDGNPVATSELTTSHKVSAPGAREARVLTLEYPSGRKRWLNFSVSRIAHANNQQVSDIVFSVTDITDQKQHENRLDRLAHFDALTGLPNRLLLHDRIQQLVVRSHRMQSSMAICYLDLDGFKQVNDTFGHAAGDKLLMEAATRLCNTTREGDTVARLGGDEFAILLADIGSEAECEAILQRILAALARPFNVPSGKEIGVTSSIGVTLHPTDDSSPDTLLRHADHAMYAAKRLGKNRYEWFDPRHEQRIKARHDTLSELSGALDKGELVLHYQPKISCLDGSITGAEALIRWQHPILGLLPPSQFLPLVEDEDLAIEIGTFVIGEALRQAARLHGLGHHLKISVNVFARQLQQDNFLPQLARIIAPFETDTPLLLDLEIVETKALDGIRDAAKLVRACQEMGISFSLDDFGTGYSTLDHLRRIPAESLKIDKSFIRNLLANEEERTLIEAIIGLGRAFNRKVVAEGVENIRQALWLKAAGCDAMQGFCFAPPMDSTTFANWLRDYYPQLLWPHAPLTTSSRNDAHL